MKTVSFVSAQKSVQKIVASTLLSVGLFLSTATMVGAQTTGQASQGQELNQNLHVNCTTGAYGQTTTCTADGSQTGRQFQYLTLNPFDPGRRVICRADGNCMYVHNPINAGVDAMTLLTSGLATAGLFTAGVVTLRKSR